MNYGHGRTPNDVEDQEDRPQTDRMRNRDGSARPAGSNRLNRIPAQRLPRITAANRDDMMQWLQGGGWRIVAAVAAFILLVLLFLMWRASSNTSSTTETGATNSNTIPTVSVFTSDSGVGGQTEITPVPEQSQAATGTRFSIVNTGVEGLFLRPQPNTIDAPLETLPDGTVVTQIGADSVQADRTWKNVQSPTGQTGWVAADYLQQAP